MVLARSAAGRLFGDVALRAVVTQSSSGNAQPGGMRALVTQLDLGSPRTLASVREGGTSMNRRGYQRRGSPRRRSLSLRPWSVVVVDGNVDAREILEEVLTHQGHLVRTFENATRAAAHIAVTVPDVVVADLTPTCLGGLRLAASLRADTTTARVALVAVSAAMEPEWWIVRCFDAFLRKPLDYGSMTDLVIRAATTRRSTVLEG